MQASPDLSWEEVVVQRIARSCKSSFELIEDPDNIISEQVLTALIEQGWRVTFDTKLLRTICEREVQANREACFEVCLHFYPSCESEAFAKHPFY